MDRSLYVASDSASQTWAAMSINNNNLANINTTGFRGEVAQFKINKVNDETMNTHAHVKLEGAITDFTPGPLMTTGRNLDIAIKRDGWFVVQNQKGQEALTRAGAFDINANGLLVTNRDQIVMGNAGPITIPPAQRVEIGTDGTVSILPIGSTDGNMVTLDRLKLVNPAIPEMEKGNDGLFYVKNGGSVIADNNVTVLSGALEGSNVNTISAMVKMMELSRDFEMQQKMIRKIDENTQKSGEMLNMNV